MKKIIFLFLAAIFMLCACNSANTNGEASSVSNAALSSDTGVSDLSGESLDVSDNGVSDQSGDNSVIIESSMPEASSPEANKPSKPTPPSSGTSKNLLIMCGVTVTSANQNDVFGDGTASASYDSSTFTYTLTLNNASLNAASGLTSETVSESYMGIYCNTNLVIYLKGENQIYIPNPNADYFHCYGIKCDGDSLAVYGDGSLNIKSDNNMNCLELYGITAYQSVIYCDIKIDLDGAKVNCGVCTELLELKYCNITVSAVTRDGGCVAQALAAYSITLVDTTVDALGNSNGTLEDYYSLPRAPYSTRYMSAPFITVDAKSEMVMRGGSAVCFNNHFYIDNTDFLPDIYCGNSKTGAKQARAIYNTVPDAFGKSYIKLVGKSGKDYFLFIGGKAVTEKNANDVFGDGTTSFDYGTKTLYLKNADITGKTAANADDKTDYAIYSGIPLNICLSGENSVKTEGKDTSVIESVAIHAPRLSFFGDGSLYVTSGASDGEGVAYSTAISSSTTYTQYGGSITAISANADKSGYGASNGIKAFGDITIHGGYLYCESGQAAWNDPIDPSTHCDMNILIYPSDADFDEGKTENGSKYIKISAESFNHPGLSDISKRMEEIEKAFAKEMDTVSATSDMVYTIKKYADMYDEIAEEYYLKLLSVGNDRNWYFEDSRYTPEEFYEHIKALKANWDDYFEKEMEIYSNIIDVQYQGGTISNVIFADHYYSLKRDWANKLVYIYYYH